jgi:NADPH2:quinone reductase
MSETRSVVVDPQAPGRLAVKFVPAPIPSPSEAVVRVNAFSLNLGEVRRSQKADAGWRPGWDIAGVVEKAAADGSGPPAGARVVALSVDKGWSELAALPTNMIAPLPDDIDFARASTLPVAGLTALLALEKGGPLLGRKVLVTGASGGVGHFACQIGRHAGARTVGLVRHADRVPFVQSAGAADVIISEDAKVAVDKHGLFDHVLESVGGPTFGSSIQALAPDGMCVIFGTSAGYDVQFDAADFFLLGGASIYGFILNYELRTNPLPKNMARLLSMMQAGTLKPHIEKEASWTDIGEIATELLERKVPGKAVLHIDR